MHIAPFIGLELLNTAVLLLDAALRVQYANPAAEHLFEVGRKSFLGHDARELFGAGGGVAAALVDAAQHGKAYSDHELTVAILGRQPLHLALTVSPVDAGDIRVAIELRTLDQQLRIAREERLLEQQSANRQLIRNLAHEIKNPLGGIRGAAQLLERELDAQHLREYTKVIVSEADRLQSLMDRLLTPNRLPERESINIHEVLERVRAVILAEYREGIRVTRDYDTSLPEIVGDKEQLIQAVLNIVRNAAQALQAQGTITLRTRIANQVTIARKRYRLVIAVQIVDNGPGVPPELADRIFYPLVTAREGGTGLGLSLAQTFVQQHEGVIEFESRAGHTVFTLFLPIGESAPNSLRYA